MKKISLIYLLLTMCCFSAFSQKSKVVEKIKNGEKQTIVVYGTSLSASPVGWPKILGESINSIYPNSVTVINSAAGAMWSTWGVQNLDEKIIAKKPDMVMIEFAINDAFVPYKTSLKVCRLNLEYMIDRILEANPECEIVLQTMNMPIAEHLRDRPDIVSYYDVYRDVAKKRKFKLIDHYTYWEDILAKGEDYFREWAPDGIHPEHKAWSTLTVPYIMKELNLAK